MAAATLIAIIVVHLSYIKEYISYNLYKKNLLYIMEQLRHASSSRRCYRCRCGAGQSGRGGMNVQSSVYIASTTSSSVVYFIII
jgi:hypothetical protein